MKPIRSRQQRALTHDPWDQAQRDLGQDDEVHVLGDDGGIESYHTTVQPPCDCGCLRPPGGYCSVCHALVCIACFGHCQASGCGRPICARHSVFYESTTGARGRLCQSCAEAGSRKRRALGIARLLLSPFIEFERRS